MKITVEETKTIEEGKHTGIIKNIEERKEPYNYIDIEIEPEKTKISMKASYPKFLSKDSKLGELLKKFNIKLEVGDEIELSSLIGKKVDFITMNKENKKTGKNYANIVSESVKPHKIE
jgi:hypothetical protein